MASQYETRSAQIPRKWSSAEDRFLREEVEKFASSSIGWSSIARGLKNRTGKDCRKRWAKIDGKWRKGTWDSREEESLRQGAREYGCRHAESRPYVQSPLLECLERKLTMAMVQNALSIGGMPLIQVFHVVVGPRKRSEDATLSAAVQHHGHDWKGIAERFFPERSRLDLSNRHASLARRQKTQSTSYTPLNAAEQSDDQVGWLLDPAQEGQDSGTLSPTTFEQLEISIDSPASLAPCLSPVLEAMSTAPRTRGAFQQALSRARPDAPSDPNHESDDSGFSLTSGDTASLFPFPEAAPANSIWDDAKGPPDFEPPTPSRDWLPRYDLEPWPTPMGLESPAPGSSEHPPSRKTIFTLENLDAETRGEILEMLCKRKIPLRMEVE
ncbi:MAG: hypothetical protein M1839_002411 [Geoglossum umbratile]|nr:MAG: hypothetical protein M1839_002411 [Geoglossum umbratile]